MNEAVKSLLLAVVAVAGLFVPQSAHAVWQHGTQIRDIVIRDDSFNDTRVLVITAHGMTCYMDTVTMHGKTLFSVVMSAYAAKRVVDIGCKDTEDFVFSVGARRIEQLNLH